MPRVPRSSLVRLAAPPDAVGAAAIAHLDARSTGEPGQLEIDEPADRQPAIALGLDLTPAGNGTDLQITSTGEIELPFFGWFFRPLVRIAHRRARQHAVATIEAALAGRPVPPAAS